MPHRIAKAKEHDGAQNGADAGQEHRAGAEAVSSGLIGIGAGSFQGALSESGSGGWSRELGESPGVGRGRAMPSASEALAKETNQGPSGSKGENLSSPDPDINLFACDVLPSAKVRKRSSLMDMAQINYGFKKILALSVEDADLRLREELKKEGFGILTEIDVKATLKEKLDVDFRPYKILGACNPPLAHQALSSDTDIGLLLPCNVIVYEGEEEGTSVVGVLDPRVQLGITGRNDIDHLANDVRDRMQRVLAAL